MHVGTSNVMIANQFQPPATFSNTSTTQHQHPCAFNSHASTLADSITAKYWHVAAAAQQSRQKSTSLHFTLKADIALLPSHAVSTAQAEHNEPAGPASVGVGLTYSSSCKAHTNLVTQPLT
jgi:hypothetical protein